MAEPKIVKKQTTTKNTIPITDVLYRTLHYWPWVLLSVAVCMGISIFYLLKTPKLYSQTASILIKEDRKGKTSASIDDYHQFFQECAEFHIIGCHRHVDTGVD